MCYGILLFHLVWSLFDADGFKNTGIENVTDMCNLHGNNIMAYGLSGNSDLRTSSSVIKHILKNMLFQAQGFQTPGGVNECMPEKFFTLSTKKANIL